MNGKNNKWNPKPAPWFLKALAKSHGESLPVFEIKKAEDCDAEKILARSQRLKDKAKRLAGRLARIGS